MVNISCLTYLMIDYIDMPMPYIIGLPRKIYKQIVEERGEDWLPSDVVLFDVDKQLFISSELNSNKLPAWFTTQVKKEILNINIEVL